LVLTDGPVIATYNGVAIQYSPSDNVESLIVETTVVNGVVTDITVEDYYGS
jgi:hypothetical protein